MCQRRQNSVMLAERYGRSKLIGRRMPSSMRDAAGDIGVAGEIEIELQRVGVDGEQRFGAAVEIGRIEDAIDEIGRQVIGDQRLLHQPEADQEESASAIGAAQSGRGGELLDEIGDARDGSGHDGGEERDGGEMFQQAVRALGVAAVEIDGVRERLERVEARGRAGRPSPTETRRRVSGTTACGASRRAAQCLTRCWRSPTARRSAALEKRIRPRPML